MSKPTLESAAVVPVAAAADYLTEVRRQAALLQTGALQTAIFNSANFSCIATDAQGVIQIFNVGAARMLGYDAVDVMNKITPAELSDPAELIARARALSLELATPIAPGFEALSFKAARGIEDIYELTYIRKGGSRLPALVSVTALRDAADAIIGYLLIGTDNTARKLLAESRDAALAAARATNLPELSQAEVGRLQLENKPFVLSEVLDKAVDAGSRQAGAKGLEFRLEIDPLVPKALRGDALRLGQVLCTLCANGARFTAKGWVCVQVVLARHNDAGVELLFRVEDTGEGVAKERQALVFEPDTEADAPRMRNDGSGTVGLAMSRQLVERMGGRLGIISRAGAGSTFHFNAHFGAVVTGTATAG